MTDDIAPISKEEMIELFGDPAPWEAFRLLWTMPDSATIGEYRATLRAMGRQRSAHPSA